MSANPLGDTTKCVRNHLELITHVAQMPSSKCMPEALQTLITETSVTEYVDVVKVLQTCVHEEVCLSLDYAESFLGFSPSLQANDRMVP
jgi:hypothetical protein